MPSTALVALTATVAFAANVQTDATSTASSASTIVPTYMAAPMPDEWFASKIIGEQVYDSAASNAHSLGKITDLIPANDGSVRGVVIGVGGFLGMGEKNVAVDYGNLKWMQNANNNQVAVLATTKESLQNAPTFDNTSSPRQSPGCCNCSSRMA